MSTFRPIASALARGGYASNDQLARRLIEAAKHLPWPSHRSLGAKIGEIDLGRPVWWLKRPKHVEALATLLQIPIVDLGLHTQDTTAVHTFTRFPELPPLKLREERPCSIAAPYRVGTDTEGRPYDESWDDLALWFEPDSRAAQRPHHTVHWLHVPSGTGLNLLWESLESRGRGDFLRVETLAECSRRFQDRRPFAVRVDREDARDLHVLASRELESTVLVVASFAAPESLHADRGPGYSFTWEFLEADRRQRREMALTNPEEHFDGIRRYEWRLLPDWQERLLAWIERRIASATHETLLTAEGVRRWMSEFTTELVSLRPADLLSICHLCHSIPERALPAARAPDAGTRLLRHLTGLDAHRAQQFSGLVKACLQDRRSPWGSPLPESTWFEYVGSTGAASVDADAVRAIADAPTKAERRQLAAEVAASVESSSLAGLQASRLLVETTADRYVMQPAFVADLVARDQVLRMITEAAVDQWASLCLDPSRRRLVDAALRVTPLDTLHKVQDQILSMAPANPLAIAAAEALFFAVGNLAARGTAVPRTLHSIAARVIPGLHRDELSPPSFWTRLAQTREQACEHLAVMWMWSLMADPPATGIPAHWDWHFPGWSSDLSECFALDSLFTAAAPLIAPAHDVLMHVAERLTTTLDIVNEWPPRFLTPLLLAHAVRTGKSAPPEWLESIIGESEAEDFFLQQVSGQAAPSWFLPVYLDAARQTGGKQPSWKFVYSPIRRWLLRSITGDIADQVLNEQQRLLLWSSPSLLPPHLRGWLLERAKPREHDELVSATIGLIGPSEADSLSKWLPDASLGPQAARRLWTVAPSIAASRMICVDIADMARLHLVTAAPPDHSAAVLRLLRDKPELLDAPGVRDWAIKSASRAGPLAEKILALATGWRDSEPSHSSKL